MSFKLTDEELEITVEAITEEIKEAIKGELKNCLQQIDFGSLKPVDHIKVAWDIKFIIGNLKIWEGKWEGRFIVGNLIDTIKKYRVMGEICQRQKPR